MEGAGLQPNTRQSAGSEVQTMLAPACPPCPVAATGSYPAVQ